MTLPAQKETFMVQSLQLLDPRTNSVKSYSFDRVFQPSASQADIFKDVEPFILNSLSGENVCIFAYG